VVRELFYPQTIAGIGQGQDLAARALDKLSNGLDLARMAMRRAVVQLDATMGAIAAAETDGEISASQASAADRSVVSARDHFVAATAAIDSDGGTAADDIHEAEVALAEALEALEGGGQGVDDDGCQLVSRKQSNSGWLLLLAGFLLVAKARTSKGLEALRTSAGPA
jgi:hypothetical protein